MKRRGRPSLAIKPRPVVFRDQCLRRQELECHGPVELRVLGPVDDAHATATDLVRDSVMRYGGADHFCSNSEYQFSTTVIAGASSDD